MTACAKPTPTPTCHTLQFTSRYIGFLACRMHASRNRLWGFTLRSNIVFCSFSEQVCFKPGIGNRQGCRALTRLSLDRMCSRAKCNILHQISNDYLDAYVLSESSLFVYPHKASAKDRSSMRETRNASSTTHYKGAGRVFGLLHGSCWTFVFRVYASPCNSSEIDTLGILQCH